MIELPEKFIQRMKSALGADFLPFVNSYSSPAQKGVRVNTLKIPVADFLKIAPFALEQTPFEPAAFYADGESLGKTLEHAAGLYYVQEPSATCAVPALNVREGERVLDLCAAPGGKSTQIAAYLNGTGVLVSNEINLSRAKILSQNIERLGVKNAVVTCASPDRLAEKFKNCFDKILVDAPCSGEGMFKKEDAAVREWSEENVAACAVRQRGILAAADKMLASGGRIVYSTCTFAPAEDEEQINNFLAEHPDYELIEMKKLYPHEVRGEGHFYAVLEKRGTDCGAFPPIKPAVAKKTAEIYGAWERENLKVQFRNLHEAEGVLYSLPDGCPDLSGLHVLRAGVRLGEIKGSIFTPSHAIAACLKSGEASAEEVDGKTALNYLLGLTFPAQGKGWKLVTYNGFPLGWCKVSDGVAKNHYPKGLRINK